MSMDFDALIAWLDGHVGQRVFAATQSASQDAGNTRLSVVGALARAEGEITLIDARPGRIEAFSVGDATLVLLEGDFLDASPIDFGAGRPQMVQAEFHGAVSVTVGEAPG
ncbi:MAG TPA: hypothetical protein VK501_17320 [Baekduia sp.]|uniref:hypothetical protein n=1 Tax=Baekduia sp. TaxID=2600305 RepID=UPI002BAC92C1|nr:hypothetical protein [Baekduia sp.]HMJ35671.1 hypothetical protein [Baekduia sp.]